MASTVGRDSTNPPPGISLNMKDTPKKQKNSSVGEYRSELDGNNPRDKGVQSLRANEIRDNSSYPTSTITDYLQNYMECDDEAPSRALDGAFSAVPFDQKEAGMYNPLVIALNKLTDDFPDGKRITFLNTHRVQMASLFPHENWTSPDIAAPHPATNYTGSLTWSATATVMEAKVSEARDPVDAEGRCRMGEDHDETLAQLWRNARSLLQATASCYVFLFGIYKSSMRIYRVDHAGVIISPAFNYQQKPEVVRELLWRLVHPRESSITFSGMDPTITRPTDVEMGCMIPKLQQHHPQLFEGENSVEEVKKRCFWIEIEWCYPVLDASGQLKPVRCFTIFSPVFCSSSLFSRATVVYRAVAEGHEDRLLALKDSWPQLCRVREHCFYSRIQRKNPSMRSGQGKLARCLGWLDLDKSDHHASVGSETKSAGLRGEGLRELDRGRTRLLLVLGDSLKNFSCTKSLVKALRDVVEGHKWAYEAAVLHRDISYGNVMLLPNNAGGFLQDLDYAYCSQWDEEDDVSPVENIESSLKDMTGTFQFMAIDILKGETHECRHDLESCYWLLVWVVLRHTRHGHQAGAKACTQVFDHETRETAAANKLMWLFGSDLNVLDNEPLTALLKKLKHLVWCQQQHIGLQLSSPVDMTHDTFLSALDSALSQDGWPSGDAALPFQPSSKTKTERAHRRSSQKRQSGQDLNDSDQKRAKVVKAEQ